MIENNYLIIFLKMFNIIIATDCQGWIGKNWLLPWRISQDMLYFRDITVWNWKNAVIMGRKTWESIPKKFRPLPNRLNCVLSSSSENKKEENWFNSLEDCLKFIEKQEIYEIFIIWWANLYNQVLNHPLLDKIYLTKVEWDYNCDVFFDWIPENFGLISDSWPQKEWDYYFSFKVYQKNN